MGSMICMNELCRATTSSEWKKGWGFKSGGFAKLCYNCGSAFENLIFCETFHPDESGWRECRTCRKHIHCGCVASKYLYEYLDYGGVACINCARHLDSHSIRPIQDPINSKDGYRSLHWCGKTLKVEPRKCRSHIQKYKPKSRDSQIPGVDHPNGTLGSKSAQPLGVDNKMDENDFDRRRLMQTNEPGQLFQTQRNDKKQETMLPIGNVGTCFSNLNQQNIGASLFGKPDNERPSQGVKDMYESINQPSLNFCLSTPIGTSSSGQPFLGGDVEGKEQSKASPFQQGQRERHILPKPPKPSPTSGSESKRMVSHARIARPPAEGRGGRNQLLPRYWPRITDQELQQLSGDLKSTIVPLFEKVLSASDAGRIGRLVLPKACAEAYFPPINQSEGLPIRIQDIKGKEWTFQFRFWPNNNSRMYVLEGVTPCIQNMQLQAGDTVIFSRIDPGGKLVMGFRKATNNVDMQDSQMPLLPNGNGSGETSFSGMADNFLNGGRTSDDTVNRQVPMSEKKKARNIGSKNKRLLMHADDAMELRITWEEIQELLRPSPTAKPNIVMVEDCEFEEYEEAPVFGKRTIFTARSSGDQEQWAQCDSCSKWRRLPLQVLLPAKWTCLDNIWDSRRCSCAAPDEISPRELEALFRVGKDPKRRKLVDNNEDNEPYGLDALATMAALGDNIGEEPSVGATTKHPRHRPGCSCIVCIQPPSGKGKHPSTCKCNVCLTVKRRFKTLMLRKKKKQAELAQAKDQVLPRDESETDGMTSGIELLQMNHSENEHMNHSDNERNSNGDQVEEFAPGKGQLDLNCDPNRDDDMLAEATAGMSMTSLVNAANLPLEYLTQNRLENLGNSLLSQAAGESEGHHPDNGFVKTADVELESKGDKA